MIPCNWYSRSTTPGRWEHGYLLKIVDASMRAVIAYQLPNDAKWDAGQGMRILTVDIGDVRIARERIPLLDHGAPRRAKSDEKISAVGRSDQSTEELNDVSTTSASATSGWLQQD